MQRFLMAAAAIAALAVVLAAQWNPALTGSTASLRGIYNAGGGVVWASGANGAILRSEDAGYMWQICKVLPEMSKLDFRAVFAWDANHAAVMSSGTGAASRLYETKDGGATWHLLFANPDSEGFWDDLAFRGKQGFILGDPVGGRFVLYRSDDLGQHWEKDGSAGLTALPGEGVFAASNSSLFAGAAAPALFFVTGGISGARVFRSMNEGEWNAAKVPIAGGEEGAGAFSIAFSDATHGVIVGGDYKQPESRNGTAAWTSDGGVSWHASTGFPSGYRSSVGFDRSAHAWIAVGPNGSDVSRDNGRKWTRFDSGKWNTLSLPWVAGPGGHIASLSLPSQPSH